MEMIEIQNRFKEKPIMLDYAVVTIEQINTDFQSSERLRMLTDNLDKATLKVFYELLKCVRPKGEAYCHMWFNGIILVAQGTLQITPPNKLSKTYGPGSIIGVKNFFKKKPLSFWKLSSMAPDTIIYTLERPMLEDSLLRAAEASIDIHKLLINQIVKIIMPLSELQNVSFANYNPVASVIFFLEGFERVDPNDSPNVIRSYYEISPNSLTSTLKERKGFILDDKLVDNTGKNSDNKNLYILPILMDEENEEKDFINSNEEKKFKHKKYKSAFLDSNVVLYKHKVQKQDKNDIDNSQNNNDEELGKQKTLLLDEYEKLVITKNDIIDEYDAVLNCCYRNKCKRYSIIT